MSKPSKIVLIGFMGSGKTTIGKKLANKLGYAFIDLDAKIELVSGKSVINLFAEEGESYFRNLEQKLLEQTLLGEEKLVLSVGGGTPCFHDNMMLINKNSTSIYLKYKAGVLTTRLKNAKTQRPLLVGKSDEELANYIAETLAIREPFYNKSNIIMESNNVTSELILNQLGLK